MFNTGEIVLAKFPFSSLSSAKRRPCLVLAKGDIPDDLIVDFITSSDIPPHYKFSVKISPLEKEFLYTGLKIESFVRVDKVATLNESLISGVIGKISDSILKEIQSKIKLLFNV